MIAGFLFYSLQDFPQSSFGNADGRKKSTAPQSPWRFFYYKRVNQNILKCIKSMIKIAKIKKVWNEIIVNNGIGFIELNLLFVERGILYKRRDVVNYNQIYRL